MPTTEQLIAGLHATAAADQADWLTDALRRHP